MIWWINYDFNWVRWLDEFHEHKIGNTGWVRNGDEREGSGTERNQKECSTFLNLHFLDQKWSKDLEFALAKLRGLCKSRQIYNLHGRVYGLHFSICTQAKQEINAMRRAFLEKGLSVISTWIMEKSPCEGICYIAAKNHNLFVKRNEMENKENAVRLIVHSLTYRGEMWRGGRGREVKEWRGGGESGSFTPTYSGTGWYDNT